MSTKKQFNSFEDMLSGADVPVLVDFYADWCGPCQMMAPILDQVNSQLQGKIRVVKIDTEKYPALASQYQIWSGQSVKSSFCTLNVYDRRELTR